MRHRFDLLLSGVAEITPALADALYEATGGDIEFEIRGGVAKVKFDRHGQSLSAAVDSAINQVAEVGVHAKLARRE